MKIAILAAAALLLAPCASVWADGDKDVYNQRAALTDMAVFHELNRTGDGFLNKEDVRGDMRLGARFDDIDTNRDEVVTLREMQAYIEKSYGVVPAPG